MNCLQRLDIGTTVQHRSVALDDQRNDLVYKAAFSIEETLGMSEPTAGHRQRLRQRFLTSKLSPLELLELLLTYAIPRRDVAPLARQLFEQFGDLAGVLSASYDDLTAAPGIGEQAATLVKVVYCFTGDLQGPVEAAHKDIGQARLFEMEPDLGPLFDGIQEPQEPEMRAFVNDEIANSLTFVPQAAQFESLDAFKALLQERLPYNSESTRKRRANHILERFFPGGSLDIPLVYYAAHCSSQQDLKPALFYHVLKTEPLASRVAKEFVWPALPVGYVDREGMREFILRYLPDIGASSQKNTLRALFTTYDLLSVGVQESTTLRFQIHPGTLEAFLYVLVAEFPEPGMYRFEELEQGPMRLWLLWDREWIHRQLYNLRDLGVLAKVSQIDTLRQFTLQYDRQAALRHYFEHPERESLALREQPSARSDG